MKFHMLFPLRLPCLSLATLLVACGSITEPPSTDGMTIEVAVTGGFAGVSYAYEVSGRDRVIRGVACVSGCDFQSGEILSPLSETQVRTLAEGFEATGILALDGTDFGDQCCDQFHYLVTYDNGASRATVQGSSEALPPDLRSRIQDLEVLRSGTVPVVVAFTSDPTDFPQDPLRLEDVSISGNVVDATVSFGGGCESHEIDLVAFGGWLESFPVQVNLFLAHEDRNDPCDAYLTEPRSFDLTPLAAAYRSAYGTAASGETTIVLRIADPQDPQGFRRVEYRF